MHCRVLTFTAQDTVVVDVFGLQHAGDFAELLLDFQGWVEFGAFPDVMKYAQIVPLVPPSADFW